MSSEKSGLSQINPFWSFLGGIALLAVAVGGTLFWTLRYDRESEPLASPPPPKSISAQVREFCGACHQVPAADVLPAFAWKGEIELMYELLRESGRPITPPNVDEVTRYYEDKAPLELPPARFERSTTPYGIRFEKVDMPLAPHSEKFVAISNVNLVHLSDPRLPELLACEMRSGEILSVKPSDPKPAWKILGSVANPGHVEVVDLDGDGIKDLLVADLGNFLPTNNRCGSVVWFKGNKDGTYTKHTLLDNVGRVADVRAADFRGVGKLDLVVAVFGWRTVGEIIYLENQTEDWNNPQFKPHILDERHGTIHVPIVPKGLFNSGRPDFVALISQEHEEIVAFLNEGGGKFSKKTIYKGTDPIFGSSGIELIDMNGDGKMDVLYTNGDVMDKPYLLKPYHSIRWLENRGTFPFTEHFVTPMYGVHRAVAADFSGSGRLDILAVGFLPNEVFPNRKEKNVDSVILLEKVARGKFARHTLEAVTCDHVSCTVGDVWGRGKKDLIIANFGVTPETPPVTIWKNLGKFPRMEVLVAQAVASSTRPDLGSAMTKLLAIKLLQDAIALESRP
jgi:hypothetical protein